MCQFTPYYDPEIGRFISEDSYWGKDSDPLSLNLYTYCGNNPVIFIDPMGNTWWDAIAGFTKGIDDNLFLGVGGKISNGVKWVFGVQQEDWDYNFATNEDYMNGYIWGNRVGMSIGIVDMAGGLKKLITSKGTAIVNEEGVIVSVLSGSSEGIIQVARGLGLTYISGVNWTSHGYKHFPQKNKSWKDIVKSTKDGPAKYKPGTNIEELERMVWDKGTLVTNGKSWKVMKLDYNVGACNGVETQYMRVEMSGNTIHGHPITPDEYFKLTE